MHFDKLPPDEIQREQGREIQHRAATFPSTVLCLVHGEMLQDQVPTPPNQQE